MKLSFALCVLLLTSSLLLGATAQQEACAAKASISDKHVISSEKGVNNVWMSVKVTNTGRCPLTNIALEISLPYGAQIISYRDLSLIGDKLYRLANNTYTLAPNASYMDAGFLVAAPYIAYTFVTARVNCSSVNGSACAANNTSSASPDVSGKKSIDKETQRTLQTVSREADRVKLLSPGDFVFDFSRATKGLSEGTGGRTVASSPDNWPAVIGHDIAMTVGFIGPCGINLPHTHPRATEINFIMQGSFQAGMLLENGVSFIGNILTPGMATIFPQGAIHFEQNLGCEPAIFVAAFNNQDPGVQTTASSFFGLPADIVGASLNISSIQTVEDMAKYLPVNPAVTLLECKKRCGLI